MIFGRMIAVAYPNMALSDPVTRPELGGSGPVEFLFLVIFLAFMFVVIRSATVPRRIEDPQSAVEELALKFSHKKP